ncbi:MAG: hypothetical protein ACRDHW_08585, partial [Ktedonobacteraceae bacterium]
LLLATMFAFQATGGPAAYASTVSSNTTYLKLASGGMTKLTTGAHAAVSAQSTTPSTIEIRQGDTDIDNPKVFISGQTPPIAPPPANTPPPNPAGQSVTSNNPGFRGFNGLSHFDQRNAGTGAFANTQFSLEPPDQGMCASGKFVLDTVNTALEVHSTAGTLLSGPTAINQFFGLNPEINRTTITFGQFSSDPKCYFDVATGHWFLTVLEIDTNPADGSFSGQSHTIIAVSQTSDPTGSWRTFSINTTDDGSNGTPSHANCPCFGDQPLIGANADGFYVTTNEFPLFSNGFNGAQVYALSKHALVEAASNPNISFTPAVVQIDASQALVPFGGLSFSIQPATQPSGLDVARGQNGTEFFLSSLDFTGTVDNRISALALTNTRTLNRSFPTVNLSFTVIHSQLYGQPVPATQKDGGRTETPALGLLNSNDDRMNQVVYAAGVLWSGVNTIVQKPGEAARSGIAFFGVVPFFRGNNLHAALVKSGYVAVDGANVLFPSIGVNAIGEGVMSFTLSGPDFFPSAAYMPI